MTPRLFLILVAATSSLASCKKEASVQEAIAAPSTDALWAFAPAGAEVAVVAADGALAPLYRGGLRVIADLEKAPGGAALVAKLREQVAAAPINLLDPAALGAVGIDLEKGAAIFEAPGARVAVLPIADPAKLIAKLGGTSEGGVDKIGPMLCRPTNGRYVCADSQTALDAAAKGGGQVQVASWPKEVRGHIEVFVAKDKLGSDLPLEGAQGLRLAVTLERGAATVRLHLTGKPIGPLAPAVSKKSTIVAGLAEKQPTGLVLVNAAGPWAQLVATMPADAAGAPVLPGGVNAADLVRAVKGEMVGYALPGQPLRGFAKVGLSSEEPVKKLLGACAEVAGMAPPGITITAAGGRCSVAVDPTVFAGQIPGLTAIKLDLWVEGGALVLGMGEHAAVSDARPGLAPLAREILEGEWTFAAWGQGAIAGGPLLADKTQLDAMRSQDPTGGLMLWVLHHMSEFGIAGRVAEDGIHGLMRIRTLWANPDDVVAAVQAKVNEFAAGNYDALAQLGELAAKHPDTPFGRDMQAGAAGLTVPMAAVGVVAAVSIPAFMSYMRHSKESEGEILVRTLFAGVRSHAMSAGAGGPPLPTPSAGPTPPLGTCCQQGGTCAPDPALWAAPPWSSLGFSVDDPHRYSYQYEVAPDGSSFTVRAIGDLDCDGQYSTFQMTGRRAPDGEIAEGPLERINELD